MPGLPGSDLAGPLATVIPSPDQQVRDAFGNVTPDRNDPAWQPPVDPLSGRDLRAGARVIYREIPNLNVQNGWTIDGVRTAITNLTIGLFDLPSQLVDVIASDSRVVSAMASRTGGLLGKPIKFKVPPKYRDSAAAKECLDAWERHWPNMGTEPVLSEMQRQAATMGFWTGQIMWDTTGPEWLPYISPWSSRFTYYQWIYRKYVAITLDGQVAIEPGDGTWILHAPHGAYRGWMQGAIRAIAPWWLARNYALRDWARSSERHGMPIGKAITPQGAAPDQIQQFRATLATLGQESIVQLPQSDDPKYGKYDLEWLETTTLPHEGFRQLIEQCNAEITLALMGQNLTSEVKEGSLAAARVHSDVRQAILEADARALSQTIYRQVARPFAALNFGDPELAPRMVWDIAPPEDKALEAQSLLNVATAINTMKQTGVPYDIKRLAKRFDIPLEGGPVPSKTGQIFKYHVDAGVVTVNEVRRSIGLTDIEGGDVPTGPPPVPDDEVALNEGDDQ